MPLVEVGGERSNLLGTVGHLSHQVRRSLRDL